MRHFKQPTVIDDEGFELDAADVIAMTRDANADRRKGELNRFGYCADCGLGPFSAGQYHCPACDEEFW